MFLIGIIQYNNEKFEYKKYLSENKLYIFSFIAFYIINFASIFYSDINISVQNSLTKISFLIFPFAMPFVLYGIDYNRIINYFIKAGILYFLISVIILLNDIFILKTSFYFLPENFGISYNGIIQHKTYISVIYSLSLFYSTLSIFNKRDYLHYTNIIISIIMIILLQSKFAFILLIIIAIYMIIRFFILYKTKLIFYITLISTMVIIVLIYNNLNISKRFQHTITQVKADKENNEVTESRLVTWKSSLELWHKYPLLGCGNGDLKNELKSIYSKNNNLTNKKFLDSHNQYLQSLSATGIIGFLILISIFIKPILLIIKNKSHILIYFTVTFMMFSFVESALERILGISYFCFFVSIFVYYNKNSENEKHYN